jgi:hypothetical protein
MKRRCLTERKRASTGDTFLKERGRIIKQETLQEINLAGFILGGRWDSNPRHSEPQSDALTN